MSCPTDRRSRWAPTASPSPSCCSTHGWRRGTGRRRSGWAALRGLSRCTASTPWPTTASASERWESGAGAAAGSGGLPLVWQFYLGGITSAAQPLPPAQQRGASMLATQRRCLCLPSATTLCRTQIQRASCVCSLLAGATWTSARISTGVWSSPAALRALLRCATAWRRRWRSWRPRWPRSR